MQRRLTSRALALAAAGVLAFGLAACGDDDDDATTDAEVTDDVAVDDETTSSTAEPAADDLATDTTVVAEDFTFQVPGPVAPGATVAFDNQDSAPHTMTADDAAFDSGRVEAGSQGEVTAPTEPGDYAFHCEIHPRMMATLTVE